MSSRVNQPPEEFDVHQLWFYKQQEARRTFIARAVLLTVICGMLAFNSWMTWKAHADMLTNVDQARLAQVTLAEQSEARVAKLQTELRMLRTEFALAQQVGPDQVVVRD